MSIQVMIPLKSLHRVFDWRTTKSTRSVNKLNIPESVKTPSIINWVLVIKQKGSNRYLVSAICSCCQVAGPQSLVYQSSSAKDVPHLLCREISLVGLWEIWWYTFRDLLNAVTVLFSRNAETRRNGIQNSSHARGEFYVKSLTN